MITSSDPARRCARKTRCSGECYRRGRSGDAHGSRSSEVNDRDPRPPPSTAPSAVVEKSRSMPHASLARPSGLMEYAIALTRERPRAPPSRRLPPTDRENEVGERVLHPQTPHIQQEPRDLRLRGTHAVRGEKHRDQAAHLLRIGSPEIKARHCGAPSRSTLRLQPAFTQQRGSPRPGPETATATATIQHPDNVSGVHPCRPGDRLHRPALLIKEPHPRNEQLIHSRTLRPTPSTQEPNASSHTHPSDPAKSAKVEGSRFPTGARRTDLRALTSEAVAKKIT